MSTLLAKLEQVTAAASELESLADLSTAQPLLPKGDYPVILSMEIVEKKDDSSKHNVVLYAKTIYPQDGLAGNDTVPINAGYTMRKYFPLQASPAQADKNAWLKDLKRLIEQVTPDADMTLSLPVLLNGVAGQMVYASVSVEPGKGEYGPSNRLLKFRPAEPETLLTWDNDLPEGLRPKEEVDGEDETED